MRHPENAEILKKFNDKKDLEIYVSNALNTNRISKDKSANNSDSIDVSQIDITTNTDKTSTIINNNNMCDINYRNTPNNSDKCCTEDSGATPSSPPNDLDAITKSILELNVIAGANLPSNELLNSTLTTNNSGVNDTTYDSDDCEESHVMGYMPICSTADDDVAESSAVEHDNTNSNSSSCDKDFDFNGKEIINHSLNEAGEF